MRFLNALQMFQMDLARLIEPSCIRLTLTLAHFAWQGIAIAMLFAAANFALRKNSANARYVLGVATLAILAACPPLTYSLLLSVETRNLSTPSADNSSCMIGTMSGESIDSPASQSKREIERVYPQGAIPIAALATTSRNWLHVVSPFATAMYVLGVGIMFMRLIAGLYAGQRLRQQSTVELDETGYSRFKEIASRWNMHFVPAVAYCHQVTVPVVIGVLRPMILLPTSLMTGLSIPQIEAMLIHEFAHIRRWDLAVNLGQRLVESLLFMHPAVWYVSHRIGIERENACDDLVLASGWTPHDYVDALLCLADHCARQRSPKMNAISLLAASGDNPSQLKQRVLRLLDEPARSPHLTRSGVGALLATVSILAIASIVLTLRPEPHQRSRGTGTLAISVRPVKEREDTIQTSPDETVDDHQATVAVPTQPDAEFATHNPVTDVRIEGNVAIPDIEIAKHVKSRRGERVTQRQIKDDVEALVRTRWFMSVEPTLRNVDDHLELVFRVLERPLIQRVEYRGAKKVKERVLAALTQLKPGSPFSPGEFRECTRRIEEYYHEKGFAFATVELEFDTAPNSREVIFMINEGPKVRVTEVKFDKNEDSSVDVPEAASPKRTRILHLSCGKYQPATCDDDFGTIKQYYQRLGFFDVEIKRELRFSSDNSNLETDFAVNEGIRYRLGNIKFVGNEAVTEAELRNLVKASRGDFFCDRDIDKDVDSIKSKYGEQGRLFCRIQAEPRRTTERGVIDIEFMIDEDKVYRVSNVGRFLFHARQHDASKSDPLNSAIQPVQPGDLADPQKVQQFKDRLR